MLLDIANGWKTAIMIVAMIAVFYFFLIKPQSDRTKKEAADDSSPHGELLHRCTLWRDDAHHVGACGERRRAQCQRQPHALVMQHLHA